MKRDRLLKVRNQTSGGKTAQHQIKCCLCFMVIQKVTVFIHNLEKEENEAQKSSMSKQRHEGKQYPHNL
jgi:hypothetical protein